MAVEVVTHWWIDADEEPDRDRHVVDRWHDGQLFATYRWAVQADTLDDGTTVDGTTVDVSGWNADPDRRIGGLTWRTLLGMSTLRGDRLHVRPAQP